MSRYDSKPVSIGRVSAWVGVGFVSLLVFVAIIVLLVAGLSAFGRTQARADANNNVAITKIQIQNQQQYAKVITAHNGVVQAQAHQRFLQSIGIRQAQDEIRKTLTPLYVQHEGIQALEAVATSGRNNTVVYVPSGQNGVPLVTAQAGTGK